MRGENHRATRFSDSEIERLRELHRSGMSAYRCAKIIGMSKMHAMRVLKGKSRKLPTPPLPPQLPHRMNVGAR
jgi:hypothetical protein